MSRLSILRDRRLPQTVEEQKQSFLVFRLAQEQFALPLLAVQKVSLLEKIFGDPQRAGISLTLHEGQQLAVIDVEQCIFNQPSIYPAPLSSASATVDATGSESERTLAPRFLLILQNSRGTLIGLPIQSKPRIQAYAESRLSPLATAYQNRAAIQCVSSIMIESDDQPVFVLNPDLLFQSLNLDIPSNPSPLNHQDSSSDLDALEELLQDGVNSLTAAPELNLSSGALQALPNSEIHSNPLPQTDRSDGGAIADGSDLIDWASLALDDFESFDAPESLPTALDLEDVPSIASVTSAIAPEIDSLDTDTIDWASIPLGDFDGLEETETVDSTPEAIAPELQPILDVLAATPSGDPQSQPESSDLVLGALAAGDLDSINWESLPLEGFEFADAIPTAELDAELEPSSSLPAVDAVAPMDAIDSMPPIAATDEVAPELVLELAAIEQLSHGVEAEAEAIDWASLSLGDLDLFTPESDEL